MNYDMHSVSLVQDIGTAVPEPAFITYRATSALHSRNMQELLDCVHDFTTKIGLSGSASMTDLEDYFRAMT